MGTAAAGAVGGAALLGGWREARRKRGPDSKRLLRKVRARVLAGFETWAEGRWIDEADLQAADRLMAADLADCFPDLETLGAIAVDKEKYPRAVATIVVDRLAERHPLFGLPGRPGAGGAAREFALVTVETSLRAALEDEVYRDRLVPHMTFAIARELAVISENANRILQSIFSTRQDLQALLAQVPNLALQREVVQLVGSHPSASVTEVAGDVARFAREYRQLLEELSTLKADDNQLRGAEQAAERALQAGDLQQARRYLAEASAVAREKAGAPVRDLARVLDREARTAMLDRDWYAAHVAWQNATTTLAIVDSRAADTLAANAAMAITRYGDNFGDPKTFDAALAIWSSLIGRSEAPASPELPHYLVGLGNALQRKGERTLGDEGEALLAEAVDAYQRAAELYRQHGQNSNWALAQRNLGAALYSWAECADGETSIDRLQRAREAYDVVLTLSTREETPGLWALVQDTLGLIVRTQGERIGGARGLALLEEAVSKHRLAVTGYDADADLASWVNSTEHLAASLFTLADHTDAPEGAAIALEAVSLMRSGLQAINRDQLPARAAASVATLASALWIAAKKCEGAQALKHLLEAETLYEEAARFWTAGNYPRYHAAMEDNLAKVRKLMLTLGRNTP